jgi:hypothetical protein
VKGARSLLRFLSHNRRDNQHKEPRRLKDGITVVRDEVDVLMKQIDDLHRKVTDHEEICRISQSRTY